MREEVYDISGMHCAACSASVEKVTRRLPGVERSDVNLVAERMTIVYDETQVTPEQIIAKVEKAGFGAKLHQEKQEAAPVQTGEDPEELELRRKKRELIVSAIFSCALLYVSMGQMLPFGLPALPLPDLFSMHTHPMNFAVLQLMLAIPVLYCGRNIFITGFQAFSLCDFCFQRFIACCLCFFYDLCDMSGDVASAHLSYIVRDHDKALFAKRLDTLRSLEIEMNKKYGEGTVSLTITHSYENMLSIIMDNMYIIDRAKAGIEVSGLEPLSRPVRGGTDGARLSFMGLPCPNLGTGGYGFHGPFEHISVEGMETAVNIIKSIVKHVLMLADA